MYINEGRNQILVLEVFQDIKDISISFFSQSKWVDNVSNSETWLELSEDI